MTSRNELRGLDDGTRNRVERTFEDLRARGVAAAFVRNREEALAKVLEMIPRAASIAHGTSTTLQEIGFVDRMRARDSGYRYLNEEWRAEEDPAKRSRLRAKLSIEADYFLGSVQAICETGEVVGSDASGSRQAFYTYGPPRVIWVAGINKLTPTIEDALRRVREVALPKEDARIKATGAAVASSGNSWSTNASAPDEPA